MWPQGRIQDFFSRGSTRSISNVRTRTQSTNQSPLSWKSIILALLKHTGQLKPLKSQTTEYSVLIFSNLLKNKNNNNNNNNNACNRIFKFSSFVPIFKYFTTGQGLFLRQKHQMNKFGSGPLEMLDV